MKNIKKMMSVLALLSVYADTFGVSVDIRGRLGKVTKTQAAVGAGIAGLATGLVAGGLAAYGAGRSKARAQAARNAADLLAKGAEIAAASPVVNVTIMHPGMDTMGAKYMSQPTPVVPVQPAPVQPTLVSSTESSSQQLETPMLASSTESSSQQLASPTLVSSTTASGEELPMIPEVSVVAEEPVAVLVPEKKDEIVIADIPVVPSAPVVVEEVVVTTQEQPETPVIPVAPPAPALPEVSTKTEGSDTQRTSLLEEIRKGKQLKSILSTTSEQEPETPVIPDAPPVPSLPEIRKVEEVVPEVSPQDIAIDTQRASLLEEIRKGKQLRSVSSPPAYSDAPIMQQEGGVQQAGDLPPAYPEEDVERSTKATEQLSAVLAASPKFQSLRGQQMSYEDEDEDDEFEV